MLNEELFPGISNAQVKMLGRGIDVEQKLLTFSSISKFIMLYGQVDCSDISPLDLAKKRAVVGIILDKNFEDRKRMGLELEH